MTASASPEPAANPLLENLTPAQRDVVAAACAAREYAAGEVILEAGAASPGVFFLEGGEAEVLAPAGPGAPPVRVATLAPGQAFGELSAFTGAPAIGTVRAASTPTRVTILPAAELRATHDRLELSHAILRNAIRMSQRRLSNVNADYVSQLERTLELLSLRNASARLFILTIVLLCITILTNHWLKLRPDIDVYSPAFAWAELVTMVLPTLFVASRVKYPVALFGITTRNLGRDLAWSSAIAAGALALLAGGLVLAGYPLAERFHVHYLLAYGPMYALHSALQEFIGRGVLLGMMLRIFDDTTWRQRHVSNVAVSVLFGVTHIHFGLSAVGLTMAFSLLLGAYYLRYRNLAGPILIHTVVGIAAFMFGIL